MNRNDKETLEWVEFVKANVVAHFDTGEVYWKIPLKGRRVFTFLGCLDTKGYVKMKINYVSTYGHRVVWILAHGYIPKMLDHINRNPSDNRLCNLREVSFSENALNSGDWSNNTSGIKGITIMSNGAYKVTKCGKHLGTFHKVWEAVNAYNKYS